MKSLLLSLIIILLATNNNAQTTVSGNQQGVWSKGDSPFLVVGEITVNSGDTLLIESGVTVEFQGHYKFNVLGKLIARGAVNDSIFFIPADTSIGWGGIRFTNASGVSLLNYCSFKYGKTSPSDYPDNHGGAAVLINSDAIFNHSLFAYNDATGDDDGMGGAIYGINTGSASQTLTRFANCTFLSNHAFGEGGAIKFSSDLNSLIDSCVFINNNCNYGGGAISFYSVYKTRIKNSLFANNFTEYGSGGATQAMGNGNIIYITNSTFYGNQARHGDGGAMYFAYSQTEIVNSIIRENPGMYSDNIFLDIDATANINYSDLPMPDGAMGSNNINRDPLFVNTQNLDFNLTAHSPCIDTATPIYVVGADTLVNIDEYFGAEPDMGAFEFYLPGDVSDAQPLLTFALYQNYPNPFSKGGGNPTTTIDYTIPSLTERSSNVRLDIYDLLGRKVATLINEQEAPGNHSVEFNAQSVGNLPSGVYYYTLRVGNYSETKKMILMK